MPREKNFTSSIPTVHLLGELERFGGPFRYSAKTPKECADALCATVRGFRKAAMQQAEYQILVNGKEVDSENLLALLPPNAKVEFVPVIGGQGKGARAALKIVAAVVLFAVTKNPAVVAAVGESAAGAALLTAGQSLAASLFYTGLTILLRPSPDDEAEDPNRHFFNIRNTVGAGRAVPIIYGEVLVGSHVISSSLSSEVPVVVIDLAKEPVLSRVVNADMPVGRPPYTAPAGKKWVWRNSSWVLVANGSPRMDNEVDERGSPGGDGNDVGGYGPNAPGAGGNDYGDQGLGGGNNGGDNGADAGRGIGSCVWNDTLILMEEGDYKKAKDLELGDRVAGGGAIQMLVFAVSSETNYSCIYRGVNASATHEVVIDGKCRSMGEIGEMHTPRPRWINFATEKPIYYAKTTDGGHLACPNFLYGFYGEIVQERWGNDRLRWEEWFKQAAQLGVPA